MNTTKEGIEVKPGQKCWLSIRRVCVRAWQRITAKRLVDSPQNKVWSRLDNAIIKKEKPRLADSFVMNGKESKGAKESDALILPKAGRCSVSGKHMHDAKVDGLLVHCVADVDSHITSNIFGLGVNVSKQPDGSPLVDMAHKSRIGVIHNIGWLSDFLCDLRDGPCVYDLTLSELSGLFPTNVKVSARPREKASTKDGGLEP